MGKMSFSKFPLKIQFMDIFTHLVKLEVLKYLPSFPYLPSVLPQLILIEGVCFIDGMAPGICYQAIEIAKAKLSNNPILGKCEIKIINDIDYMKIRGVQGKGFGMM